MPKPEKIADVNIDIDPEELAKAAWRESQGQTADAEPRAPAVMPNEPGYATLAGILQSAHDQAAHGKGRDRHADNKPFLDQPIMEIARMLTGIDGHMFQTMKKSQEAARMVRRGQYDAAVHELLGIINYASAAVLLIREA